MNALEIQLANALRGLQSPDRLVGTTSSFAEQVAALFSGNLPSSEPAQIDRETGSAYLNSSQEGGALPTVGFFRKFSLGSLS